MPGLVGPAPCPGHAALAEPLAATLPCRNVAAATSFDAWALHVGAAVASTSDEAA